jgi:tetratricopeptide (TPR) repeat protein
MNDQLDAPLLKSLLTLVDKTEPDRDEALHRDDETLALFALGQLTESERIPVVEHLADCARCRQVASRLLCHEGDLAESADKRGTVLRLPIEKVLRSRALWAVAASVIAAIGLWFVTPGGREQTTEREAYRQANELLAAADFDQVQRVLAKAQRQGIRSDRLLSLEVEALRGIRAPVALSLSGRLDSFGYDLDGSIARGAASAKETGRAQSALDRLGQTGSSSIDILLNRGHALLSLGRPRDALVEFDAAAKQSPANDLAWLGLGLAKFMVDDVPGAEKAFRRCLKLAPDNQSAAVNLAMTLDEQGKRAESTQLWRAALERSGLSDRDRKQIQQLLYQRGGQNP